MAANFARRTVIRSTAFLNTLSPSSATGNATKFGGFASTSSRQSQNRISFLARLPVELGCVKSLMPLHSVTASSLLLSKLSSEVGIWGWLSEEFATPL